MRYEVCMYCEHNKTLGNDLLLYPFSAKSDLDAYLKAIELAKRFNSHKVHETHKYVEFTLYRYNSRNMGWKTIRDRENIS